MKIEKIGRITPENYHLLKEGDRVYTYIRNPKTAEFEIIELIKQQNPERYIDKRFIKQEPQGTEINIIEPIVNVIQDVLNQTNNTNKKDLLRVGLFFDQESAKAFTEKTIDSCIPQNKEETTQERVDRLLKNLYTEYNKSRDWKSGSRLERFINRFSGYVAPRVYDLMIEDKVITSLYRIITSPNPFLYFPNRVPAFLLFATTINECNEPIYTVTPLCGRLVELRRELKPLSIDDLKMGGFDREIKATRYIYCLYLVIVWSWHKGFGVKMQMTNKLFQEIFDNTYKKQYYPVCFKYFKTYYQAYCDAYIAELEAKKAAYIAELEAKKAILI